VRSSIVFLLALFSFSTACPAQIGVQHSGRTTRLIVQIKFEDDRPVGPRVDVTIIGESGLDQGESSTDDTGTAQFRVPAANYRFHIRGEGIKETTTEPVEVFEGGHFVVTLYVKREGPAQTFPGGAVSVLDLKAPHEASDELRRGQASLDKKQWQQAQGEFQEALRIYPSYPAAYNDLGTTYVKEGNLPQGQRDFENAVELDDHFSLAYVNLSKADISIGDYRAADAALQHATALDTVDPEPLVLAAQVDLLLGKYDEAVQDANKVHQMPHAQFAVVHYIAARALRHENKNDLAVTQYKLFLKEASEGPTRDRARAEMEALKKHR
jgi:tetratricopeptide (TPR) repeat protein